MKAGKRQVLFSSFLNFSASKEFLFCASRILGWCLKKVFNSETLKLDKQTRWWLCVCLFECVCPVCTLCVCVWSLPDYTSCISALEWLSARAFCFSPATSLLSYISKAAWASHGVRSLFERLINFYLTFSRCFPTLSSLSETETLNDFHPVRLKWSKAKPPC